MWARLYDICVRDTSNMNQLSLNPMMNEYIKIDNVSCHIEFDTTLSICKIYIHSVFLLYPWTMVYLGIISA